MVGKEQSVQVAMYMVISVSLKAFQAQIIRLFLSSFECHHLISLII